MKRSLFAALGLSLFLVAGNAHAVLFQFYTESPLGDEICPNAEAPALPACPANDIDSVADGNGDGVLSFSNGGITVMAEEITDGSHLYADYNPEFGGLGALITGEEEDEITNPDNLINGQSLLFSFDQEVTLITAVHFDADHLTEFTDGIDYVLVVDGGTADEFSINVEINPDGMQVFNLIGTTFEFRSVEDGDGFYVSAFDVRPAIPEPGTAMLLGLGFIGLGAARRRAA